MYIPSSELVRAHVGERKWRVKEGVPCRLKFSLILISPIEHVTLPEVANFSLGEKFSQWHELANFLHGENFHVYYI